MKKLLLSLLLVCFASCLIGCQMDAYNRDDTMYIRGQVGLGVGQTEDALVQLPNVVEYDVPAMSFKITSPLATQVVEAMFVTTGGTWSWIMDSVVKLLGVK